MRQYATTEQLAAAPWSVTHANADRLLQQASRLIDLALRGVVYDVDDTTKLPTDTDVAQALQDAACAHVSWLLEQGDTTGSGAADKWPSVGIGSVSLARGYSGAGSDAGADPGAGRLAPEAIEILLAAGLDHPTAVAAVGVTRPVIVSR